MWNHALLLQHPGVWFVGPSANSYGMFVLTCISGLYLSKWVQTIQGIPEANWSEKEKDTMSVVQLTVNEADLPSDKAARPLSAQVAYACSIILKGVNTWGISPLLLTALNEYASGI